MDADNDAPTTQEVRVCGVNIDPGLFLSSEKTQSDYIDLGPQDTSTAECLYWTTKTMSGTCPVPSKGCTLTYTSQSAPPGGVYGYYFNFENSYYSPVNEPQAGQYGPHSVFLDNFQDDQVGSTPNGWTVISGNWGMLSKVASRTYEWNSNVYFQMASSLLETMTYITTNPKYANFLMEFDMAMAVLTPGDSTRSAGVQIRKTNVDDSISASGYVLRYKWDGVLELVKMGSICASASVGVPDTHKFYHIAIRAEGYLITVYFNNVKAFTYQDIAIPYPPERYPTLSTYHTEGYITLNTYTEGYITLNTYDSAAFYDNIKIERIP
jgi:hypothetical protein